MIKRILLGLFLVLPMTTVLANEDILHEFEDNGIWEKKGEFEYISPTFTSSGHESAYMKLYYDQTERRMAIRIRVTKPVEAQWKLCKLLTHKNSIPVSINGLNMTLRYSCYEDRGVAYGYPVDDFQRKYIIDQFLTRDWVHIGKGRVTTDGFAKGYSDIVYYMYYLNK